MTDENITHQDYMNYLHDGETKAVQDLLVIALRCGFQLNDLILLAKKYHTSVAVTAYHHGHCIVNYATGDGYFTRHFGTDYQQASEFTEQFALNEYQ